MPLRSTKNEYAGVNAHLHSNLQNRAGGWIGFHNIYIDAVGQALQTRLDKVFPGRYLVDPTKSVQVTEIDDTELLTALAVASITDDSELGETVTWLEVLSPTNKIGLELLRYRQKRAETITQQISLIEFDYLHETPSVIGGVPRYPNHTASFPYSIAVTDQRPMAQQGKTFIYGFHVDEAIPEIYIPLKDEEFIRFDPNPSYDAAFERFPALSYRLDYAQVPVRFDTYSQDDQDRIAECMRKVTAAAK